MNKKVFFDKTKCIDQSKAYQKKFQDEYSKQKREMYIGAWGAIILVIVLNVVGNNHNNLTLTEKILCATPFILFSLMVYYGFRIGTEALRLKIKIYQNSAQDLVCIEELLTNKKRYALYLRDYSCGENFYATSMVKNPSAIGGYTLSKKYGSQRLSTVSKNITKYLPIVMLSNPRDKTDDYTGHVLHCDDNDWYDYFKILANHAYIIILDYEGDFLLSKSIKKEINYVKKLKKHFILVGDSFDIEKLEKSGINTLSSNIISVFNRDNNFNEKGIVRKGEEQHVIFSNKLSNWFKNEFNT